MVRQVFSHSQESRTPPHIMVPWEDKHCLYKHSPVFSFTQLFILNTSTHHKVWNVPLVTWGQLSQLFPLPTPCAPPARSLVGWCERLERPWLCVTKRPAQQWLRLSCLPNMASRINPKHSPISATRRKIKSYPSQNYHKLGTSFWYVTVPSL